MWGIGESLRQGVLDLRDRYGISLNISGLGPLLFMHFEEDFKNGMVQLGDVTKTFYSEMIQNGVFLHPIHNWYTCGAHTQKDVESTLEAMEDSLKAVKKRCYHGQK
jgi:glutamate-1-semialdehyde 2,1-aminomutase